MISSLSIKSFKTLVSVDIEPGAVNVLVGANGSGKSNFLEALAVLSAAASGRVDPASLRLRGSRPGTYFRPMFEGCGRESQTTFRVSGAPASYQVSLSAPAINRLQPWKYEAEDLSSNGSATVAWNAASGNGPADPTFGLAALRMAETPADSPVSTLLRALASFCIFSPDTPVMRGLVKDIHEREPVGLSGGRLAEAVGELMKDPGTMAALGDELRSNADWFDGFGVVTKNSTEAQKHGLAFLDRYFWKEPKHWYSLGAEDVNEGVLHTAFLAILGLHPAVPPILAVENVDHGLNPLLAKQLISVICERVLKNAGRQLFLTTHNPLVLDGLPLQDNRVRLFTVDRDNRGHTVIHRLVITDQHRQMADDGWTLSRMWVNKLIGGVPDV